MASTFLSVALFTALAACGGPDVTQAEVLPLAPTLEATGLHTLATRAFTPQYPLWTDGAAKHRRIHLPSAIDGAVVDAWQFPVGTKLWKQFSFDGVVAETRFMERTADGWRYATYVDGQLALAPIRTRVEIAPGITHVTPGEGDCRICHDDGPLGFTALQLSSDRDPNAAHRETPEAGALDLAGLIEAGLVRGYRGPAAPRIAGAPTERAARGYLHGNCGGCHNARTALASLDLDLAERAVETTVGRASRFAPARARVAPGAPMESVVIERMRARDPVTQMPPLGSQLVDRDGVELVSAWIAELK